MYKVMLIDDEPDLHEAIADLLEAAGYAYCGYTDAQEGLEAVGRENPDLLLLDVMMPRMNGFKVCETLRERGQQVPVVFLTAKGDIVDKSVGFQAGADDYVVKPFDSEELLLRIDAHIRRYRGDESAASGRKVVRVGDLEVRFEEYTALLCGELVPLTTKEFEIVAFLAASPGKVFTREQIYEHIWGEGDEGRGNNNVTVFMRRIREKLEKNPSDPRYILTVQRIGYKLAGE